MALSFVVGAVVGACVFVLLSTFNTALKPLCRGRVEVIEPAQLAKPQPKMSMQQLESKIFFL
jgi:hypothetical protein